MKTRILIVLVAAFGLLAACKEKSSKDYEALNKSTRYNDSEKMADSAREFAKTSMPAPEKLVKTASINFKVKDVSKTGADVANLTKQYGGMVMHHQTQSTAGSTRNVHISNDSIMRIASFNTTGEMTVRVPSEKLEDFMTTISHMGIHVNVSNMDIDDESFDYLSNQLKLKDREDFLARQKAGTIKIKNPANVLALTDDMVDQRIANLRTDAAVKFSVVSLSFYQSDTITKETVVNDDPSAYNIPFGQRISLALANGWSIFVDVLIGLTNIWMFILTGVVAWRVFVYYRKRTHTVSKPAAN